MLVLFFLVLVGLLLRLWVVNVDADKIDYNFKITGFDTFKVGLKMAAPHHLMNTVFSQGVINLTRLGVVSDRKDINDINGLVDGFVVPKRFYPNVILAVRKILKKLYKKVAGDGIVVLRDAVTGCTFDRDGDFWLVNIVVEGFYVDKRKH